MWSIINNNFICSEKELLRVNKIHLEKLLNMKSDLNTKGPVTPFFLKNKSYLREIHRTREYKRNNDNNIIFKKLIFMSTSPSPYSKHNIPKYCPAFDKQRFNFNKIERELNIYNDNISFYKRFSAKKSNYSANKYFKKNDYENIIKHNISKSKFLPQVSLKMCTYRQFKSNLLKESNKIKEAYKSIIMDNKINKRMNLGKSKSYYNILYRNRNILPDNLRYNNKHLNIINNLYYNDLDKYNSQSLNLKSKNIQRSQSASIINLKNNFIKSN